MHGSRSRWLLGLVVMLMLTLSWSSPVAATTPQQSAAIITEDSSVSFGDFISKTRFTYVAGAVGPFPTVIMIHGGCPCDLDETFTNPDNSVQSHIFKDIGDYLTARGIAVLRYNKHYVSSPTDVDFDKFSHLSIATNEADAEKVLAAARTNPHIDPKRIYLYGWSEGSLVAADMAVKHPELAGLILQGATARADRQSAIEDYTLVRLPYTLSFSTNGKVTTEALKRAQATTNGWLVSDFVDASKTDTVVVNPFFDANHDGVLDPQTEILPKLGELVDQMLAPGSPFEQYNGTYTTVSDQASAIKMPVLVLQGEQDALARAKDIGLLSTAFKSHRDFTLLRYAGLGHSLGPASSLIDDLFRPIAAQPMADMAAWLLARATALPLPNTGIEGSPVVFPQTGYSLDGALLSYWSANGGLPVFGYPIDSARLVNERPVQWLERARFELHPENAAPYPVLLGRLGVEALQQQGIDWRALPKETSTPAGCRSFAATGHTLCSAFLGYWQSHGLQHAGATAVSEADSLALFGYPISAARMETNANGETVLTQWFERARFEYHPDKPVPYQVLLGRLGAELHPIAGQ